jgi:hypothetical protein
VKIGGYFRGVKCNFPGKKRKEKETKKWRGKERKKKILGDVFWFFVFFVGLRGSSRGRRVFLIGKKTSPF